MQIRRLILHPLKRTALLFAVTIFATSGLPIAAQSYFTKWPAGTSPQEVGKRIAENFVARKLEVEDGKRQFVIYPEACAWYGSLTVASFRSEEHTSELQSPCNLVCRLLLEKKNTIKSSSDSDDSVGQRGSVLESVTSVRLRTPVPDQRILRPLCRLYRSVLRAVCRGFLEGV